MSGQGGTGTRRAPASFADLRKMTRQEAVAKREALLRELDDLPIPMSTEGLAPDVAYYAELMSLRRELGGRYSDGWVAHAFKERFGRFPPWRWRDAVDWQDVEVQISKGTWERYREWLRKRCEGRENKKMEAKKERARERAREKRARERGQTHAPADEPGATLESFFTDGEE